jgi:DNA polymerase III subunit gamma/tau
MSHIALYRKYRPTNFNEVKGQDSAVAYLTSIIASGRVPHAILLTGGRGTGKTTLARIFARELGVSPYDIYEIDAASNNGVEEIRNLREEVHTRPAQSKYKVYILDEVHMLSKQAFNAFLKTLEEPPEHVIFVMATTELHKILPTVVSRCQVITLEKPNQTVIADQLVTVAKSEEKILPQEFALLIAERAHGSFRDALVMLDQVLEHTKGATITESDITSIGLRSVDHLVFQFLSGIKSGDKELLFTLVQEIAQTHRDGTADFLEKVIQVVRIVLYSIHVSELWKKHSTAFPQDQQELLLSYNDTMIGTPRFLEQLLDMYRQVKQSNIPEIPLELAIIEILSNNTNVK